MLIVAEILISITYRHHYADQLARGPAVFWLWQVPFKIAIMAGYAWIWLAKSRRANIAALAFMLVLFSVTYWQYAIIGNAIGRAWGYG